MGGLGTRIGPVWHLWLRAVGGGTCADCGLRPIPKHGHPKHTGQTNPPIKVLGGSLTPCSAGPACWESVPEESERCWEPGNNRVPPQLHSPHPKAETTSPMADLGVLAPR